MRIGMGWLPCVPGGYSPLNGEPITQCNSISDQSPCFGEGPFAFSGYCPAKGPGYEGLLDRGVGSQAVAMPCPEGMISVATSGMPVCLPPPVTGSMPGEIVGYRIVDWELLNGGAGAGGANQAGAFDWTKAMWIGGVLLLVIVGIGVARR